MEGPERRREPSLLHHPGPSVRRYDGRCPMDAVAFKPDSDPSPVRIARYTLEHVLGTGGMATVYLAHTADPDSSRVALKLMHPHLRTEPTSALEFIEEARLAVRINHPNVVGVTDIGTDPHGLFLVMQYIEGMTLSELLRAISQQKKQVPPAIALRMLDDFLRGLHAAHALEDGQGQQVGLVHRDVSPSNVLVGLDGVCRIADFGIAKATDRASYTQSGVVKGKAAYMSPEQIRGDEVDCRTDVWSAGIVAWELLCGERLFVGRDELRILLRVTQEDVPRLAAARLGLPEPVVDAVKRALSRDRDARFATAEAFRMALVQAWEAVAPMASTQEVSVYVHSAYSELSARGELNRGSGPHSLLPPLSSTPLPRAALEAPPAEVRVPARRRWPRVILAGGVIGLIAALGWGVVKVSSRVPPGVVALPVAVASKPLPELAPALAPLPSVPLLLTRAVLPPVPVRGTAPEVTLTVFSSVPLRRLTVGGRLVSLGPRRREVTLSLAAAEASAPVELTWATLSGRRGTRTVPAGTRVVRLTVPSLSRAAPGPDHAASGTGEIGPKVPDNPY